MSLGSGMTLIRGVIMISLNDSDRDDLPIKV